MGKALAASGKRSANFFDECTPEFRQEIVDLCNEQGDRTRETLEFYYRLGTSCKRIRDSAETYLTPEQRNANVDPLALIERALHTSKTSITKSVTFVTTYSKEEFEALLSLRNPDDNAYRVHWGHVVHLLGCGTPKQRQVFENRCVKNAWTPDMLHQKVMEAHGGPRRSGGRPMTKAKTTDAQMRQVQAVTDEWVKRNEQVWNSDTDGTFTALCSLSPDKVTEELLENTKKLRASLFQLYEAAEADVKLCDKAIEYQQSCMEAREAAVAKAADDVERLQPVKVAARKRRIASA
jgi:hypothetical protein